MSSPLHPAVREVIRIPIIGPEPFNTLAYVRFAPTSVANEIRPVPPEQVARIPKVSPSPLVISGFDPSDERQQRVEHSSTAVLTSLFVSDDGTFTMAADSIDVDTQIDPTGRVMYTWYWAGRFDDDLLSFVACISSWVLLYEPRRATSLPAPRVRQVVRNVLAGVSDRPIVGGLAGRLD
ncbi:hypothetical protein [Mycolicibacterium mageritense]|uniref:hypothetical protein n=1 Tax=Mycolicibacterium mageritense TaxID=53462 RepID=UPI0011D744BD|nr:hypothetical protein [Mycolicibacterium mageritense]TXI56446.1 MAG: hypothetical protein E6Q55_28690 [Mycolicibacterium mageritense]